MNWTRKHNGDPQHHKEWYGGRGRYRIIWRDQVCDVTVPPAFQCCVLNFNPMFDRPTWELVERIRRPLHRTFKAAKNACEKHANPDYKPVRKVSKRKRKAPMKTCSKCGIKIHVRKAVCDCGYKFPKKVKR